MSSMSIAAFNALPDVTPSMGQELRNINGKLVNVPVMIQPAGALLQRDDDGMFMDPRDGSTWMVGWVDGVRVRRRAAEANRLDDYICAFTAACDFIDAHIGDPDMTPTMVRTYAEFQKWREHLKRHNG